MSVQGERLLAAIEAEIKKISKLEHMLARTKIVLQEQARSFRSELEFEQVALSQAREGSEALQKALDESLEHEAEVTRRAELLEVKLDGIPLALNFLLSFARMLIGCCAEIHARAQRQRDYDLE